MRWLTHDWDSRDPSDDLHDIDTGKYLSALQAVPQNIRSLIQDTDIRVEVEEIDGHYRITKIVKKREPEFLQGSDSHFYFDGDGKRIPVSEEEMDRLLGITHNPDDLYNTSEIARESIHTEHHCPRDVWDLVFDATEFIREAKRAIELHNEGAYKLEEGVLEQMADKSVYSADWFPYSSDRRLHGAKSREIAARIENGISRAELARLLRRPQSDQRPMMAKKLYVEASKLVPGVQRGQLMVRAQRLQAQARQATQNYRIKCDEIGNVDRNKLWAMWREREINLNGTVKLTSWQFEKAFSAKLNRQVTTGQITREEARERLSQRMKQHYSAEARHQREDTHSMPQWLEQAVQMPVEVPVDEVECENQDWLPEANFTTPEFLAEDTVISDGNEHYLLNHSEE